MHNLYANTWNETVKLALRKKTVFFMILSLLIPIGAGLLFGNFQSGFGINAVSAGEFPITMLSLFTAILLPLFVFMGAADLFSGEQGNRTMKIILTRPISRFKIFASKQISLAIYIVAYLFTALIGSVISSIFLNGELTFAAIVDWLIAYGTAFLPLVVLSIVAVLLAQFFTSSSGALTISILLYIGVKVVSVFIPQVSTYSPTAYLDWHMLWLENSLATGQIWNVFMFLLACSILCFTAGYYYFDKKEL
jgi:ABC-2 type transport system permease protein